MVYLPIRIFKLILVFCGDSLIIKKLYVKCLIGSFKSFYDGCDGYWVQEYLRQASKIRK